VVKGMTIRQVVLFKRKRISGSWHLEPIFVDLKRLICESSVRAGSPSFVAAPDGPETCP